MGGVKIPPADERHALRIERFLRRDAVQERTGLSPSTIYELMALGAFPRPVKISKRSVGWLEHEIAAWQAARIADRDR
jgi:prophage regulatory protein